MIKAFYSDPHFGHTKIVELCQRPFKTVAEMDEALIYNYNSVVGELDTVLWLGDCFFGTTKYAASIMKRLHGTKLLVMGSHDYTKSKMLKVGFEMVMDSCIVYMADHACIASHYPEAGAQHVKGEIVEDTRCPVVPKGMALIHGHTHSPVIWSRNSHRVNVGVDAWNYYPARRAYVETHVRNMFGTKEKE